MSLSLFLLLALLAGFGSAASTPHPRSAVAVFSVSTGRWSISESSAPHGGVVCAHATFSDEIETKGWGFLEVTTQATYAGGGGCSDEQQAFAAGLVEGYVTWLRMYQFIVNEGTNSTLPPKVAQFLKDNDQFVEGMILKNPTDPFFYNLHLLNTQLRGLYEGYTSAADPDKLFSFDVVRAVTLGSDIGDIEAAVQLQSGLLSEQEALDLMISRADHCSALVKFAPNYEDLFISQVTWSSLTSMMRIYKLYSFPWTTGTPGQVVPAVNISFSSYPGLLGSADDYYMMSSGLVSLETTIGYYNTSLSQYIQPNTVLEWARVMLANRLATSGSTWSNLLANYNSGTYNNEWLILNYNLFQSGSAKQPNDLLWIADQIPGTVTSADVTSVLLANNYFASYNLPYFPSIYNLSGVYPVYQQYGNFFSYSQCPRALIFARNQSDVVDLKSFMSLMRYNNFQNDPLARCEGCNPPYSGENAISCRSDLNPANGTYPISALGHRNHAGTDAKVTSATLFAKFQAMIISGPTNDQQPTFVWSQSSYANHSHIGMPDVYNFPWLLMDWTAWPSPGVEEAQW